MLQAAGLIHVCCKLLASYMYAASCWPHTCMLQAAGLIYTHVCCMLLASKIAHACMLQADGLIHVRCMLIASQIAHTCMLHAARLPNSSYMYAACC